MLGISLAFFERVLAYKIIILVEFQVLWAIVIVWYVVVEVQPRHEFGALTSLFVLSACWFALGDYLFSLASLSFSLTGG